MEKKQFIIAIKPFLLVAVIILLSACNNNSTRIKLLAPDNKMEEIIVEEQRVTGKKEVESGFISSKGKFDFKLNIEQPKLYNLLLEDGDRVYLLLNPQDEVKISLQQGKLDIQGSSESVKLNNLYDSLFATRNLLKQIENEYNITVNQTQRDSLSLLYNEITQQHYKYSVQFVLENLTSMVSMAALYQELAPNVFVFGKPKDLQFFKLVSDSLTKYYPKDRHVLALQRNFNSMHNNYKVEQLLSAVDVVEEALPEIELPDAKGITRSLLKTNKRYVLLNVWSANDKVSHTLFPSLKNVFNTYRKKDFTIYNVYMGKSLDEWERIVKFEEIDNWINVADTNFPNSRVIGAYNIQNLPANYLIDIKDKNIIARNINPTQLNQKLSQLLN